MLKMQLGFLAALLSVGLEGGAQAAPKGWAYKSIAPMSARPRVLLIYDMEGLSGIDREDMVWCSESEVWRAQVSRVTAYHRGQDRLVADVNAVVDGLLAGGAKEIVVLDAHGSGCDETPDLPADRLDKRARLADSAQARTALRGDPWDAFALVGMHASPGHGGFLEHTGSFGEEIILNGVSIMESDKYALDAGERATPVIFASGDDRLVAEVRTHLPWVTTTVVKRATSRTSAELRPAPEVAADLRAKAEYAMRHRSETKALAVLPPFTGAFKPVFPESFELLKGLPGLDLSDGMFHASAASRAELGKKLGPIMALVERLSWVDVYSEIAERHPEFHLEAVDLWDQKRGAGPPAHPGKP